MTYELRTVSVKLPVSDLRRIPGNRSAFIRRAVTEKLFRASKPNWKPATAGDRKLLALKERHVRKGGQLLGDHEIAAALRERRGGVADQDISGGGQSMGAALPVRESREGSCPRRRPDLRDIARLWGDGLARPGCICGLGR